MALTPEVGTKPKRRERNQEKRPCYQSRGEKGSRRKRSQTGEKNARRALTQTRGRGTREISEEDCVEGGGSREISERCLVYGGACMKLDG